MKCYVLLLLFLCSVWCEDGSGDGDLEDGDVDDLSNLPVPTRVVPQLQSPTPSGLGHALQDDVVEYVPQRKTKLPGDNIYIEDGSGMEELPPDMLTPTWNTHSVPPSSGLTPTLTSPEDFGSSIVTGRLSNQPPVLQRKLRKIPVVAGKAVRWRIPEDTFRDPEDGNTRHLKLTLRHMNGSTVGQHGWIRFDQKSQELWIMPVDENDIGRWRFPLTAEDKQGQMTSDILEVVVRQFSGSRLVNHEFELAFDFVTWKANMVHMWEWKLLDIIRQVYGDANTDHILVKRVTRPPFIFAWTNSSLIQQTCPRAEIEALFGHLVKPDSSPSEKLVRILGSNVSIKNVRLRFFGSCLDSVSTRDPGLVENSNRSPVIRNAIDRINVTAGELLRYTVPEDTCYDVEDGSTSRLTLHLLTMDKKDVSSQSWLQFDVKNQQFYGVPLEEEVGRTEYQLVCSDRQGYSAIDGIEVIVVTRPFSERFGVEFALVFAEPVVHRRVFLVDKIASFFGGRHEIKNIVIKSVNENTLVWYNKTLALVDCDDGGIEWVRTKLMGPEEGSNASQALLDHFRDLQLLRSEVILIGQCAYTTPFPEITKDDSSGNSFSSGGGETIFHGLIPSSEYLLTFLVPAVIITCMLLLAIILACALHRKRKAGKLSLFYSEPLPPRGPVILQDELFDERQMDPLSTYQPRRISGQRMDDGEMMGEDEEEMNGLLRSQNGARIVRPTPAYQRK